jgi:Asp-tRNA(Asn)/Glu-tRNA(Gln) amidotransferase A subunit family amidase
MELYELSATDAARRMHAGEMTSEELTRACLTRIEAMEPAVQAWTYLDPERALDQAREADASRHAGADPGPLHGLPVGVKDIFDTRDMPTECGTPLYSGRQPNADSRVVSLLREAGAVLMGKTVTTELAMYTPGKTTNPHDATRTPGGSSSGSAAGVAAYMVPLALGSQTNGSVIRPASYCGVYGFKPTFGSISRRGVLGLSSAVDTMGVFARSVEDLALVAEPLFAYDEWDTRMRVKARPHLVAAAASEPPVRPALAFVKSPVWKHAEEDTRGAFAELVEILGDDCDQVDLPEPFERAVDLHRTIIYADMAKNLAHLYDSGRERLSDAMCAMIEEGRKILAVDYNGALDMIDVLYAGLEQVFERYDAIVTPATAGEAPVGLDSTGSPIFCTLWTLLGVPAVSLPLLQGSNDMPMGVQLVGPRNDDARLLRNARWLERRVMSESC